MISVESVIDVYKVSVRLHASGMNERRFRA